MKPLPSLSLLPLLPLLFAGHASAAIIVSDSFEEATHPGSALGSATGTGIPFEIPTGGTTFAGNATIANNPTFGRVLFLDDTDASAGTTTAAVGRLPGLALLTTPGDTLNVSFKFRFTTTSTTQALRFGFFNSSSTSAAGTGTNDDTGYYVNLVAGGTLGVTNTLFYRENATIAPAMGGTDRTNYVANAAMPALPTLTSTELYNISLTLTRTATGIDFLLGVGVGAGALTNYTATTTNANPLITSFDEVMFNTGFNATTGGTDLIIDDLTVDATHVIPEPSAATLAALAGLAAAGRRKRARA